MGRKSIKPALIEGVERYNVSRVLYQPIQLVSAGARWNKMQTSIMVKVLDLMQERIKAAARERAKAMAEEAKWPSLFTTTEMSVSDKRPIFTIAFSDLGVSSKHYPFVAEVAMKLLSCQVFLHEGEEVSGINLFERITVPVTATGRRKGVITFVPTTSAMEMVFTLDRGYSKAIKDAIIALPHNVDRIYMNLMQHKANGVWHTNYKFLRWLLKLDFVMKEEDFKAEQKDSKRPKRSEVLKDGMVRVSEYSRFRDFNDNVLKKAKEAINSLASHDQLDISIKHIEIKDNYDDPDNPFISFYIAKTKLGLLMDESSRGNQEEYELRSRLRKELGITMAQAGYCLQDIDHKYYKQIYDVVAKIKANVEAKNPRNKSAYTYASLFNYTEALRSGTTQDMVIEEVTKAVPSPVQTVPESRQPEISHLKPGEGLDKWAALLAEYDGPNADLLQMAKLLGMDDGLFSIFYSNYVDFDRASNILSSDNKFVALLRKYSSAPTQGKKIKISRPK